MAWAQTSRAHRARGQCRWNLRGTGQECENTRIGVMGEEKAQREGLGVHWDLPGCMEHVNVEPGSGQGRTQGNQPTDCTFTLEV